MSEPVQHTDKCWRLDLREEFASGDKLAKSEKIAETPFHLSLPKSMSADRGIVFSRDFGHGDVLA
jgi:hypothetical protein